MTIRISTFYNVTWSNTVHINYVKQRRWICVEKKKRKVSSEILCLCTYFPRQREVGFVNLLLSAAGSSVHYLYCEGVRSLEVMYFLRKRMSILLGPNELSVTGRYQCPYEKFDCIFWNSFLGCHVKFLWKGCVTIQIMVAKNRQLWVRMTDCYYLSLAKGSAGWLSLNANSAVKLLQNMARVVDAAISLVPARHFQREWDIYMYLIMFLHFAKSLKRLDELTRCTEYS